MSNDNKTVTPTDASVNREVNREKLDMQVIDKLEEVASALSGVCEALGYRTSAEEDGMLSMLADVIDDQVKALRDITG